MQKTTRISLLLCALLMAIGAPFIAACGGAEANDSKSETDRKISEIPAVPAAKGTRVETAVLGTSDAVLQLKLPGEVKGSRDALLGTAMGGFVEAVLVSEGQKVSGGQALVKIDTRTQQLRVDQAKAQYEQANKELERAEGLGARLSEAALDNARTQTKLAKLGLQSAELQLSRSVITAPFAGVVAQMDLEPGEIAGPGSPVVRLVKLTPVSVSLSVSDRDVVALREGLDVKVSSDARSGILDGRIKHISPAASLKTRSFVVEIEVPNKDGSLLPGMIAHVSLSSSLGADTLVVPQDYLVTRLDGLGVFVEEEGVARWRPVRPGAIIGDQIVLSEGVSVGDRVVVTGQRELAEGDPLIITRHGRCCEGGRTIFELGEEPIR